MLSALSAVFGEGSAKPRKMSPTTMRFLARIQPDLVILDGCCLVRVGCYLP